MAIYTTFIDPSPPSTSTMIIMSMDSFDASTLYAPGFDSHSPLYTFTSDQDGKRVTLHYGQADGLAACALIYHGHFKMGLGTARLDGREEVKLEHWARMLGCGVAEYRASCTRHILAFDCGLPSVALTICVVLRLSHLYRPLTVIQLSVATFPRWTSLMYSVQRWQHPNTQHPKS
jgi:hypothetical protein